ncbi:MAG: ATP-binding cassette domain-containing protein [Planctomycetes bacterium]|nr:ATP-binding cassette domain-containing protein [Planctomycetota bacterium]
MIEVKNLRKVFGKAVAVDDVSFAAAKGDVLGFLGPNGAGKSTTMKMLACFLTPDGGTATVNGFDIRRQSLDVRRTLGYLPENAPCYEEMTVRAFLEFIGSVRGLAGKNAAAALERVVSDCALEKVLPQTVGTLSKGFRRRVGLAQALLHDPATLILDEPTDGLDPNQKHQVRELIKKLASDKCIVISTHILEEVDAICNRAVIIAAGRKLADGTPEELRRAHGGGTMEEIFRRLTLGEAV